MLHFQGTDFKNIHVINWQTKTMTKYFNRAVQPPKWSRPRNDPQPLNDPQIDPEMIPTFLLVDPEMIPKELGNGN